MVLVVTAVHTFVAEHGDELEFQAGEQIEVLEKDEAFNDGWWRGKNAKGEEGLFPATYIDTETTTETTQTETANGAASAAPVESASHDAPAAEYEVPKPVAEPIVPAVAAVAAPKDVKEVKDAQAPPHTESNLKAPASLSAPRYSPDGESPHGGAGPTGGLLEAAGAAVTGAAAAAGNAMNKTIGDIQEAIDGIGHKDEEDEDAEGGLGIGSDTRARLAEQARLANEKSERERQRQSGGVQGLVYSDESEEDDDDHLTHHANNGVSAATRGMQSLGLNGGSTHGSALGTPHEATIPENETPMPATLSPTFANAPEMAAMPPPPTHIPVAQPPMSQPLAAPAPMVAPAPAPVERALEPALPLPATPPLHQNDRTGSPSVPNKPPVTWTVEDVVQWAKAKGFDESIYSKFIEHDISGDLLLELDANLLKELDIPQFGKRLRVAQAISELRRPGSTMSASSQQSPIVGQGSFATSGTTSIATPTSAENDHHAVWAHGRKVSATPSTGRIDEKTDTNGIAPTSRDQSITSSSMPNSPATPSSQHFKRDSTGSIGHKKNKASIDNKDRLSFFGRARKPPPAAVSPAADQRQASRMGVAGKPQTLVQTAAPETLRKQSVAVGSGNALSQIGKPDRAGYMKKRGERYNTWKTRFFVLKGSHLYYMKSEHEDKVKGHIDLKGHRIIVDGDSNPGNYGFRLVGSEKPHYFSSSEQGQIREWMKAIMKATIVRDYAVPVTSSCNIPTIPLAEAQAMQPRPPSPAEREATQRANRRENVNQLTARDASVLMSLDTTSGQRRRASQQPQPSRPSKDLRRPSSNLQAPSSPAATQQANGAAESRNRPSVTDSFFAADDDSYGELLHWVNVTLPPPYPKASGLPESFTSGEVIFLLVRHLSGINPSPPVPPQAFSPSSPDGGVEGLFAMMDLIIEANIDPAGVTLNEIRAGDAAAIARLVRSVKSWSETRGIAA